MKYFRMTFVDAVFAVQEVREIQETSNYTRATFNITVKDEETCVWTDDLEGERLLRDVLATHGIVYQEDDKQYVYRWLEETFPDFFQSRLP